MLSIRKTYITEVLLFVYLVYSQIISILWFSIPRLSFIILIITYCSTFIFANQNRNKWRRIITPWFLLSGWFMIGLIYAFNKGIVANQTIDFISGIILISIIYCIVEEKNSISSIVNIYLIFALIITIVTLKNGVNFNKYASILRMSYSENVNSNEVGYILALGIWCCLYKICDQNKVSIRNIIFNLIICGVMFYTILLTNSRKSIIGIGLIFVLWLILCYGGAWKKLKLYQKIIITLLLIPTIFYSIKYIQGDTLLYTSNYRERLSSLISDGDNIRTALIQDAFNVFLNHPIVGVGLNNYQYYSIYQMYSHCDYIEIFVSAGLIGGILYFTVYFSINKYLIKKGKLFMNKGNQLKNIYYAVWILFIFMLYIGIGKIHMYEDNSMYAFGIIIAFITSTISSNKQGNYKKYEVAVIRR